jgi:DNA-binding response OmpR family regulator
MGALNVLVVDDVYPAARALAYILAKNDYRSRIARDGAEALQKIAEEKPQVIILDLKMPGMDGIEVCRRIRASEEYKDIYIIAFTSLGEDEDLAKALEVGANECLTKPLNPSRFLERVREVLKPVTPGQ